MLKLHIDPLVFLERGPWDNEPINGSMFIYKGYNCFTVRNPIHGHWAGYVHVTQKESELEIGVHGGITYKDKYVPNHREYPELTDDFYIGFDTGHPYDYEIKTNNNTNPLNTKIIALSHKLNFILEGNQTTNPNDYKTLEYCIKELHKMVDQLIVYKDKQ